MKHEIVIGILAAAGAFAWYLSSSPASTSPASTGLEGPDADRAPKARSVATFGVESPRPESLLATAEPAPSSLAPTPSDRTAEADAVDDGEQVLPPETDAPTQDRFTVFRRRRVEELERRLATRVRDADWEAEVTQAVTRESARVQGGKLQSNGFECTESVCRVTFLHEAGNKRISDEISDMVAHISDRFGVEISRLEDRSIVYLERKPRFDPPPGG